MHGSFNIRTDCMHAQGTWTSRVSYPPCHTLLTRVLFGKDSLFCLPLFDLCLHFLFPAPAAPRAFSHSITTSARPAALGKGLHHGACISLILLLGKRRC
jgi:hypothetical protein